MDASGGSGTGHARWAGLVQRLIHGAARFTRPLTMGVRGVLLDDESRVFLVRHSYMPGWSLPGGAVEVGETAQDALVREVREECNIAVRGAPKLHGVYLNAWPSRRDHVLVYVVRDFSLLAERRPDWEIVDGRFFAIADLPADTTRATRTRLEEVTQGLAPASRW